MIFIEAVILSWYFAGFLLGVILFTEDSSPIFSAIVGLFFGWVIVSMTGFNPTPQQIGLGLLLYIPIGLVYALWKYRLEVNRAVRHYNEKKIHGYELEQYTPANMTSVIASWTILWAVSLPFNFLSEFISELKNFISTKMRGILTSIYDSAMIEKRIRKE